MFGLQLQSLCRNGRVRIYRCLNQENITETPSPIVVRTLLSLSTPHDRTVVGCRHRIMEQAVVVVPFFLQRSFKIENTRLLVSIHYATTVGLVRPSEKD